MTRIARTVPNCTFPVRIDDDQSGFRWGEINTETIFGGRRVLVFSLPGAFTPTCSLNQLPGYEAYYQQIRDYGIDDIYCLSVNDTFCMNAWFRELNIDKVKAIPDGTGEFTRLMGMLVDKGNVGFGLRSWRYAMIVNDKNIEVIFEEPGYCDNAESDPYEVTDPNTILNYLKEGLLPMLDGDNSEE